MTVRRGPTDFLTLNLREIAVVALFGAFVVWTVLPSSIAVIEAEDFDPALLQDIAGRTAALEPVQINLASDAVAPLPVARDGTLTPMALYAVEARVLGVRRYRWGRESQVSNLDLALGWGEMIRDEVVDALRIWQRGRFYYWRMPAPNTPLPLSEIIRSSANTHIIAANPEVRRVLRQTREGQHLRLEGLLVNVDWEDGYRWRTSMVRTDTGSGACEIFWVHRAERLY